MPITSALPCNEAYVEWKFIKIAEELTVQNRRLNEMLHRIEFLEATDSSAESFIRSLMRRCEALETKLNKVIEEVYE